MSDIKPDSDFRTFSKKRGTRRKILFRVYSGIWWIPVHAKGFLLPLAPFAFTVAWGSLLEWLGFISYRALFAIPILAVCVLSLIQAFLHCERG